MYPLGLSTSLLDQLARLEREPTRWLIMGVAGYRQLLDAAVKEALVSNDRALEFSGIRLMSTLAVEEELRGHCFYTWDACPKVKILVDRDILTDKVYQMSDPGPNKEYRHDPVFRDALGTFDCASVYSRSQW